MINRPDIEPIVAVQNKVLPNVEIDGTAIGRSKPPYIIAELSANHMGSLDRAVAIVRGRSICRCRRYKAANLYSRQHYYRFKQERFFGYSWATSR